MDLVEPELENLKDKFSTLITEEDKRYAPKFVNVLRDCLFNDCSMLKDEVSRVLTTGQVDKMVFEVQDLKELPPIFVYPYDKLFELIMKNDLYEMGMFIYERLPFYVFIVDKMTDEIGRFLYEKIRDLPIVEAQKVSKNFPIVTLARSVLKDLLPVLKVNGEEVKDSFEENYEIAEIDLESGEYADELPNVNEAEQFFGIKLNEEQKKEAELDKLVEILNELDELDEEIDSP